MSCSAFQIQLQPGETQTYVCQTCLSLSTSLTFFVLFFCSVVYFLFGYFLLLVFARHNQLTGNSVHIKNYFSYLCHLF